MKTALITIKQSKRALAVPSLACLAAGCTPVGSGFLNPAGPVAEAQRELLFWVLGVSLVVVVPVLVLTPWLLWRYRWRQRSAPYRPSWDFSLAVDCVTWGVPLLVVLILGVLTWQRTHQLDPYRPLSGEGAPLEVQVIALDWKWLFIYPQQRVASLNELVIPRGRPVHLSLTSATVMQSMLIGQLSGQIYAMAGMRTQQYLQADRDGSYTGRNTQFNGAGFQQQSFQVRALVPEAFAQWLATAQQAPERLDREGYQRLSAGQSLAPVQHWRAVEPGLFDDVISQFKAPRRPAQEHPHE